MDTIASKTRKKEGIIMKRRIFSILLVLAVLQGFVSGAWAAGTPAGTTISNQAYVDYKDANGNAMPRVFSNTVTVTVSQVAAVSTTPETMANSAVAGTNIAYPVTITNDGNGTDTFALEATTNLGTVILYKDDNGDGIWQPTETTVVTSTGALVADQFFKAIAVVAVPAGAANGTTITTTFTATSAFNGTVKDTSTFTTTVQTAVLAVSKSSVDPAANTTLVTTAKPGDVITFMMTVANTGAPAYDLIYRDVIPANTTYVAGSMKAGASTSYNSAPNTLTDANDGYEFTAGTPPTTAQVGAYFDSGNNRVVLNKTQHPPQGNFYFQVRVNNNVPAGTVISNSLTVEYALVAGSATRYTATSNTATVSAANLPAVLLDPDRTGTANPGDSRVYAFTAYNNGNDTDTINLTYTSTAGWAWTFWNDTDGNGIPGTNGDTVLTDTNGDGKIDTGVLTALGSKQILAVATVPAGAADKLTDVTTVTGASVRNSSVTDTEVLTTTVTAPVLSVVKAVSPTGNQPPGTVLTYTVTVTNNGTGNATNVIITDAVPQYTTYQTGTIKTGATTGTLVARTDASDGDGARYDGTGHTVMVGSGTSITIGPSGAWILEFKVKID